MNLRDFSRRNRARCEAPGGFNHPLSGWSLSDWMTATMGELGEAANVAKKLNRVRDGVPGNKETPDELRTKLADEIADTFIYLDLMAQAAGLQLSDIVPLKFAAKSAEIGYVEPPLTTEHLDFTTLVHVEAKLKALATSQNDDCENVGPMEPDTGYVPCRLEKHGDCICAVRQEALEQAAEKIHDLSKAAAQLPGRPPD